MFSIGPIVKAGPYSPHKRHLMPLHLKCFAQLYYSAIMTGISHGLWKSSIDIVPLLSQLIRRSCKFFCLGSKHIPLLIRLSWMFPLISPKSCMLPPISLLQLPPHVFHFAHPFHFRLHSCFLAFLSPNFVLMEPSASPGLNPVAVKGWIF
jgi:hypothetical protein